MKRKAIAFVVSCLLPVVLMAQPSQTLIGRWQDQASRNKQIQMYSGPNGKIYGKAINDTKTAKKELIVFKDLEWDDKGRAFNGLLINPENGSELNISIHLSRHDQFEFVVKRFFLSRTFRFLRVEQL